MATKRSQRIAIWVIAIALAVGTIGSFLVMMLSNDNLQATQDRINELTAEYHEELNAYETKLEATQKSYFKEFSSYEKRVGSFSADDVTELKVNDLEVGEGEAIAVGDYFDAYYIGWNPEGKMFDSSLGDDELNAAITAYPGGVIQGWIEGTIGMKPGGVRELTIPAGLAYADIGSGDDIPPGTPLKFIVAVPLERPQPSDELIRLLNSTR